MVLLSCTCIILFLPLWVNGICFRMSFFTVGVVGFRNELDILRTGQTIVIGVADDPEGTA